MGLNQTDFAMLSRAYHYIVTQGGVTYIDKAEALSANTVVNAAIQIENDEDLGPARARAWANAYIRWGDVAKQGHRLTVFGRTDNGSLTVKDWTAATPDEILEKQVSEARIPRLDDEVIAAAAVLAKEAGPIDTPPTGGGGGQGKGDNKESGVNWDPLIQLAAMIGTEVVTLVKTWLANEYVVVNTMGLARMRAGDRLCVWLGNADDEASVYLDKELVASRSLNDPETSWDYSARLKPGTHMIMVTVKNSGRFDWSVTAHLARQSDYGPKGSKKPFKILERQDTDGPTNVTHIYYMKLEVV